MASDQYLVTAGARLRYRDEGAGPAIVLVHGWTLDLDMWNPQADSLQAHFRIIRFDRRGYGLSSGSPDLEQDVTDSLALCDHLGVQPVGYVGMSQGARVVLQLIRMWPDRQHRFVLDGPPALVPEHGPDLDGTADSVPDDRDSDDSDPGDPEARDLDYSLLQAIAQIQGLQAFRNVWLRHPLATLETHDPQQHQLLRQMIDRYPGRDLQSASRPSRAAEPLGEDSVTQPWPTQPGLVVNGALDTDARLRAGEALARALPNCQRAVVPCARHLANLDNPDVYNSLLLHFFSQPL